MMWKRLKTSEDDYKLKPPRYICLSCVILRKIFIGSILVFILTRLYAFCYDYFDLSHDEVLLSSKDINVNNLSACTGIITDLRNHPCFSYTKIKDIRGCSCTNGNKASTQSLYQLTSRNDILSHDRLTEETIFTFIHINKAGGTTIKRDLLQRTALKRGWDGAAFGSYKTWSLLQSFNSDNLRGKADPLKYVSQIFDIEDELEESRYLSCGEGVEDEEALEYLKEARCSFRVAWGAMGLGLCDVFQAKSCVYLTVLRNPIDRLVSSYNYVCVEGAEHKKKWPREWRRDGFCPLNITEFFGPENKLLKANPNLMVERLSKGCSSGSCAKTSLEIAMVNLKNPCLRYLILENFEDGLSKLRDMFPVFKEEINTIIKEHEHRNEHGHSIRVKEQLRKPGVLQKLKKLAEADIKLFEYAVDNYETAWQSELQSC